MPQQEIRPFLSREFFQAPRQLRYVTILVNLALLIYAVVHTLCCVMALLQCKMLETGDRILAIDGQMLDGADYLM